MPLRFRAGFASRHSGGISAGLGQAAGEAKMELFDYIEVFYNQRRRHSTLGQISPAAFERRRVA